MRIELNSKTAKINKANFYWLIPLCIIFLTIHIQREGILFMMLGFLLPVSLGFAISYYFLNREKWIAALENECLIINKQYLPSRKENFIISLHDIKKIIYAGSDIGMVIVFLTPNNQIEIQPDFIQSSEYIQLADFIKSQLPASVQIIEREMPSMFEAQHGLYIDD